jgi:hypothetical protein
MSDDFGTVNMKPRSSERAREIEIMRDHYRRHREALQAMSAEAPTEYLAGEYRRLIKEIDISLGKLDELEGKGPAPRRPTEPGQRPLVTPPAAPVARADDDTASPGSRMVLILVAGLLVLGALSWLIWRASSEERPVTPVVREPAEVTETTIVPAPAPETPASALGVEPAAHDYGIVRKGTRAARQFEIVNVTDAPISIKVARSTCRCLYYDYGDVVPPKGRETLTVTVDGAKAPEGQLLEEITISSSADSAVATTFTVNATIR